MKFKQKLFMLPLCTLVALCGAAAYLTFPANAQSAIRVQVNGQPIPFRGVYPDKVQGRVLVPLRGVFEAMNAFVDYSSSTRTVTAVRGDRRVELQPGARAALVNGRRIVLDVPAMTRTGRVLIPIRFVSEALGANVFWDGEENTVRITTTNSGSVSTPPRTRGGDGGGTSTGGIRAGEIELRAESDKKHYKSGEPVRFTLTAINQDERPRVVRFFSGQSFDITITQQNGADHPRWDWSHDRMFTQAIREVTLKPGEVMTFNAVWNQQNNEGSEMPRGDYIVQAKLTAEGEVVAQTFTIRLVY